MALYDPADGWKYGFPKPYKPLPNETLAETLIRDGYPKELAEKVEANRLWCRFLGQNDL